MPSGYTFQPTDEKLVDFLVQLNDGKNIHGNTVGRVNLFDSHPAVIIRNLSRSHHLLPCMLGSCKYYLFYCEVPEDATCCELGYYQFEDQAKGVWEPITYSFVFRCGLFDGKERLGEVQKFRYKYMNEATSWRMDMYGLADLSRQQSNMVILKVYESADSKNAVAVKSLANMERDVHCAKVQLLEVALLEEMMKRDSSWLDLGAKTHLIKKVKNKFAPSADENQEQNNHFLVGIGGLGNKMI